MRDKMVQSHMLWIQGSRIGPEGPVLAAWQSLLGEEERPIALRPSLATGLP